jgi:hypothetical protein
MEPITLTLNDKSEIANVDFVQWIMNEIEDKKMTRKDVAHTYSILMAKGHQGFTTINEAIIKRWSPAALRWIKETAWKWANDPERRAKDLGLA